MISRPPTHHPCRASSLHPLARPPPFHRADGGGSVRATPPGRQAGEKARRAAQAGKRGEAEAAANFCVLRHSTPLLCLASPSPLCISPAPLPRLSPGCPPHGRHAAQNGRRRARRASPAAAAAGGGEEKGGRCGWAPLCCSGKPGQSRQKPRENVTKHHQFPCRRAPGCVRPHAAAAAVCGRPAPARGRKARRGAALSVKDAHRFAFLDSSRRTSVVPPFSLSPPLLPPARAARAQGRLCRLQRTPAGEARRSGERDGCGRERRAVGGEGQPSAFLRRRDSSFALCLFVRPLLSPADAAGLLARAHGTCRRPAPRRSAAPEESAPAAAASCSKEERCFFFLPVRLVGTLPSRLRARALPLSPAPSRHRAPLLRPDCSARWPAVLANAHAAPDAPVKREAATTTTAGGKRVTHSLHRTGMRNAELRRARRLVHPGPCALSHGRARAVRSTGRRL